MTLSLTDFSPYQLAMALPAAVTQTIFRPLSPSFSRIWQYSKLLGTFMLLLLLLPSALQKRNDHMCPIVLLLQNPALLSSLLRLLKAT